MIQHTLTNIYTHLVTTLTQDTSNTIIIFISNNRLYKAHHIVSIRKTIRINMEVINEKVNANENNNNIEQQLKELQEKYTVQSII